MAKNNEANNQSSKFSSLLAGTKVLPKKSISDFLEENVYNNDDGQQNINVNNNENKRKQPNKLKLEVAERNVIDAVEDRPEGLKPGKNEPDKTIGKNVKKEPEPNKKEGADEEGEGQKTNNKSTDKADLKTKKDKKTDNKDLDWFLEKSRSHKTKPIFINENYDNLIGKIVSQIGKPGLSKAGYLENILTWYFETFGEEIKARRKEALQKQNDDL